MSVSDRIGVFRLGRLMQVGPPPEVYRRPTSLFVADFIGKINFFPAELTSSDAHGGRARLRSGAEVEVGHLEVLDPEERVEFGIETAAVVAVRPEHLRLAPEAGQPEPGTLGTVRRALFLGSIVRYFVTCDDATKEVIVETADPPADVGEGSRVRLSFRPQHATCFRS